MTIIALLLIAAGLLSFFLAIMVAAAGARAIEKGSFAVFASAMAVWSIGIGIFLMTPSLNVALTAVYAYYVASLFIVYGLLLFAVIFTSGDHMRTGWFTFLAIMAGLPVIAISAIILTPTDFIELVNVAHRTVLLNREAYDLFTVVYLLYGGILVSLLLGGRLHNPSHRKRAQRLIIGLVIGIGLPLAAFFNLILPLLGNYSLVAVGPMFVLPTIIVFFYAIMRHSLFDVRLALVRTFTYVLSLATLAVCYLVLAFLISNLLFRRTVAEGQTVANAVIALGLAFAFQPIKQFFDRITNFIFYHNVYNVDDFFTRFTKNLSVSTEIHELLQLAATDISKTLKASFGAFYIYREPKGSIHISTDNHQHAFPIDDARALDVYAQQHRGQVVVRSQLVSDDDDTQAIRRLLVSHRLELVLPIFREEAILGYLLLGSHLSGRYTIRDIRTLATIADELAIAIENALSVQEVRDLNDTLQQRISSATRELRHSNSQLQQLDAAKDEFISMASHQLRTPLTTIKGYISMVIEGDAGKIAPEQEHLLEEAFTSSERMVRLIGDFLNVSRLQTGKFIIEKQSTNLAKVVSEELESLSPNAAARGIKFVYKEPKNFPTLYLDETKIRQVIMNFSDNALYYSGKGKTVDINLKLEKGEVIFTVKDHGIGVPKEQQAHLFEKFFRATNARSERPDGTGVGLFLAKRVIDDHRGGLIFESTEGKGSTFGFRLPLSEAQVPDNQKPLA